MHHFLLLEGDEEKALSLEPRLPSEPELSSPEGLGYFPSVLFLRTYASAKLPTFSRKITLILRIVFRTPNPPLCLVSLPLTSSHDSSGVPYLYLCKAQARET